MFFCLNLTFVYSIEEQFEVHLGLGTVSLTRGNHRTSAARESGYDPATTPHHAPGG